MKGWLDKYGKEINANEGRSSAPENWVGEGYSNVGRNYSPAWGGQFAMGGSIKAKDGKWMQKVSASIKRRGTEGKCTPITKPGCLQLQQP